MGHSFYKAPLVLSSPPPSSLPHSSLISLHPHGNLVSHAISTWCCPANGRSVSIMFSSWCCSAKQSSQLQVLGSHDGSQRSCPVVFNAHPLLRKLHSTISRKDLPFEVGTQRKPHVLGLQWTVYYTSGVLGWFKTCPLRATIRVQSLLMSLQIFSACTGSHVNTGGQHNTRHCCNCHFLNWFTEHSLQSESSNDIPSELLCLLLTKWWHLCCISSAWSPPTAEGIISPSL